MVLRFVVVAAKPADSGSAGDRLFLGIGPKLNHLFAAAGKLNDHVSKVDACDGQLEWACLKLGIPRLTHHKLRYWFGNFGTPP